MVKYLLMRDNSSGLVLSRSRIYTDDEYPEMIQTIQYLIELEAERAINIRRNREVLRHTSSLITVEDLNSSTVYIPSMILYRYNENEESTYNKANISSIFTNIDPVRATVSIEWQPSRRIELG